MTQTPDRPTVEQLLNLAGRAERGPLTGDEAARLRDGIANLDAALDRLVAMADQYADRAIENGKRAERAERAEATLNAVRALLPDAQHDANPTLAIHPSRIRAVLDQHGQTPKETT